MSAEFAFDELFDQDYLDFYAAELNDETNDYEAAMIAQVLHLDQPLRILDLPCGHGRIARRLAQSGHHVTGIDRSALFLDRARDDAKRHSVAVDYREGDMRTIGFEREFDVVLSWFTSFGYFDDDTLRTLLLRMHRALVPGGRLVIETMNVLRRSLQPFETSHVKELVDQDGTHFLIDRSQYDPHDGRLHVRRFLMRSGRATREVPYQIRLFTLPELRDWLSQAGFDTVQGFGGDGEVFEVDSDRLVVIAQRS